jgi:GNAT superfamily N-acetyltransferase
MPVRPARVTDAAAIASAHYHAWQVAYRGLVADFILETMDLAENTQRWVVRLQETPERFHVYEEDSGRVLGFVALDATRDADDDPQAVGEIWAFYVHPDGWGKGYGRALWNYSLEWMKQRGFSTATLWVLTNNHRARGFYEKMGFFADGTTKAHDVRGDMQEITRYRQSITFI